MLGCVFNVSQTKNFFSKYAHGGKLDYEEFATVMAVRGATKTGCQSPRIANQYATEVQPSFSLTREPPNQILSEIRVVIGKKGIYGIRDFVRLFNSYSRNGLLGRAETRWCLRENGQSLSDQEFERIFKYFDKNNDDFINIHEFIAGVRGELNEYRQKVVDSVFT